MDGADQNLNIHIISDADNTGFNQTAESGAKLSKSMGAVSVSADEVKDILNKTGGESLGTREKLEALHFSLESLGATAPGLSEALRLAFNPVTIGVAGVGLLIEGLTGIWDNYKAKIKEVAEEQEAAFNKMTESANKAAEAVKALDHALHPKNTIAEKDQEALQKKIEGIKTLAAQQKEINKANVDAELAAATSDQKKQEIRDRYGRQNTQIDELTQSQIAGAQEGAGEQAGKQIAGIDTQIAAKKALLDQGNAQLQAEADEYAGQLKNLDFTHDPSGDRHKELSGRIAGIEGSIADRTNAFSTYVDTQKKNAGGLGEFADKTQAAGASGQAAATQQRGTDSIVARAQRVAEQEAQLLAMLTGRGETLGKLLEASGKSQAQDENILREIISGHLNLAQVVQQLRAQIGQNGFNNK